MAENRITEIISRQNEGVPFECFSRERQVQMWYDIDFLMRTLDQALDAHNKIKAAYVTGSRAPGAAIDKMASIKELMGR